MKTTNKLTLLTTVLALGASCMIAAAQDNTQDGPPGGGPGQRGPGMRGHRPPPPAIVRALDANHDGVIDADEIANASAALKTLDKNGDGKLTPEEFMGPRPPMHGERPNGRRMGRGGFDHNRPPGPPPGGDNGMNGYNPPPDAPPGNQ